VARAISGAAEQEAKTGRRRRAIAYSLAVLLLALAGRAAPSASASPAPLFGVTVDEVGRLEGITRSLSALPRRATTRVYFDVHQGAEYYARAVRAIHGVSGVMGELLDSSDEQAISSAELEARVASYLSALGASVDIWEIGNEVNGNWTGNYALVAEKLSVAFDGVRAAGGRTALTLYANEFGPDHCGDGAGELSPGEFSRSYVPGRVAAGVDYVLLSYYPTQCGGREPSAAEVAASLKELHAIYPGAALGFGELGLPRRVRRSSRARAEQIMRWAYLLNPGLPYYVGGYFWWYGAEDALRPRAPLTGVLREAFLAEAGALGA
jgi:hypothetical protein